MDYKEMYKLIEKPWIDVEGMIAASDGNMENPVEGEEIDW